MPVNRLILTAAILLAVFYCIEVHAGTYTVTTLDDHDDGVCDSSDCTLREAINAAQSDCWDAIDLIVFSPSLTGTIQLKDQLPSLGCPMILDGDGRITIGGGNTLHYGLLIYAWDGMDDPDIVVRGLTLEGFATAGIIISPSGQVLVEGVEVRGSGVGLGVHSTSQGTKVTLRTLSIHDNRLGIYIAAPSYPGETEIRVESSRVYGNGHGIWVDGSSNPLTNVFIGDPSNSNSGNYVYGNSYEGIVLSGDVRNSVVAYNVVGTDGSSPRPNALGGVVLANGVRDCYIINNEVAYNGYQNILLTGSGTEGNYVDGNYVHCDSMLADPLCYIGIYVGGGASGNRIGSALGNIVAGHKYEGIAVVGGSDDNVIWGNRVGSFNADGSYNGNRNIGNGAGIGVLNAAAPGIHYPFPVYAVVNSANVPGPSRTLIQGNEVAGNRGAGVILIRAQDFEASGNMVYENSFHGFYWVGSSGIAYRNTVQYNEGSGFRIEPYWGLDSPSARATSPSTYNDDILSVASQGIGIYGNFLEYNKGYGLLILDNPWAPLSEVMNWNFFWGNEPSEAVKLWLGHVRVVDPSGNPVAGLEVDLFRGGDDGDGLADYSCVTGADGRCGPPGLDYDDASTWFLIAEEELIYSTGNLIVRNYNPYGFALSNARVSGSYSWDGTLGSGESGYAIESPPNSGAFRYQYAQLTYAAEHECTLRAELNATSLNGYPVSPGEVLNYTLTLAADCDRTLSVEAIIEIPRGLHLLSWQAMSGGASYDAERRSLVWRGSLRGCAEVLNVTAEVSGDNYLGNPLVMRANISCLSPNCYARPSDDPLTPKSEDATIRPLSLIKLYVPPLKEVTLPINLSIYGNFSLRISGCESWSLSPEWSLNNGSIISKPRGDLSALSPNKRSSCEVTFVLIEPSNFSKPLLESTLALFVRSFSLYLETSEPEITEPEIRVEVSPKRLEAGRPFVARLTLVNPAILDVNVSLRIPMKGLRLLSITYHTGGGEFKRAKEDLIWIVKLPAQATVYSQLVLIPEVEGELSLGLRLLYTVGGLSYEKVGELRLEVARGTESSAPAIGPQTGSEVKSGNSMKSLDEDDEGGRYLSGPDAEANADSLRVGGSGDNASSRTPTAPHPDSSLRDSLTLLAILMILAFLLAVALHYAKR